MTNQFYIVNIENTVKKELKKEQKFGLGCTFQFLKLAPKIFIPSKE